MSDMRFIITGIVLIFLGFLILQIFGHDYQMILIEKGEFNDCNSYFDDSEPSAISCDSVIINLILLMVTILGLIVGGIILLVKGVKGDWDNKVNPEDMVGPSNNKT